jgi:hypothetical protein
MIRGGLSDEEWEVFGPFYALQNRIERGMASAQLAAI